LIIETKVVLDIFVQGMPYNSYANSVTWQQVHFNIFSWKFKKIQNMKRCFYPTISSRCKNKNLLCETLVLVCNDFLLSKTSFNTC